ncbi:hypothetical protein TrVFT333_001395 [Trichoderma virens FT-333]|nr:hypothetical protein TrVFT333_001395 [Trichoderma virens FT-333]
MAHVTLSDGLAIWQLIYYVVTLICSIFVSCRHGLSRSSGWIFLTIFSTMRVIGCSAQIATITATSDTAETIATITGFLGLSPLLLATLGILSRIYFDLLKRPFNIVFSLFLTKIVQVPAVIALILCIVGATSADTPAGITSQDTVKAGNGVRFQDAAAEASTSAVLTELFMARIEEMIVVLLYLYAGLTQKAVPERENSKRSNKEKLAYRAAREILVCDHGTPSCTPCVRAKVNCSGYRNLLDLNFKDQSKEVIRNYLLPARKKRRVSTSIVEHQTSISNRIPGDSGDSGALCGNKTTLTIPRADLVYPVQEIARSYLYVNYMTGGPHCGYMSYLLPLMKSSQNSAVNAAVNAVALAALSNIRLSPKTMLKAQQEYTTALSKTNLALKDPVMCKTDDVLAAVVMLGIFEVMTCTDGSFIDRWVNHMEGAVRLIEVRGSEQLSRPEGLALFTQLRAQVSLSRIYQERYSSSVFTKLTEEIQREQNSIDQILDQLSTVIGRLTDFCANVTNKHIIDPTHIIRTALKIDAEMVSLMISVPTLCRYATVKVPMFDGKPITQAIWGDSYHIYHSISASTMWNNYRSVRIIIQELIIDTVKELEDFSGDICSPQRSSLASQARQTMLQLVQDICSSVPYNLGIGIEDYGGLETAATSAGQEINIGASLSSFQATGAGGLTIMWPLLVAANSGVACNDLRKWIANCLDKIGHSMGINQALAMSKLIKGGIRSRAFLSLEYRSHPYKL